MAAVAVDRTGNGLVEGYVRYFALLGGMLAHLLRPRSFPFLCPPTLHLTYTLWPMFRSHNTELPCLRSTFMPYALGLARMSEKGNMVSRAGAQS